MDDYKATVHDGIKIVPHVQEIKQMFPNAPIDHFITSPAAPGTPAVWNSVAYIYGRYEFGYQINVKIDSKHDKIGSIEGIPTFYLWEVATVSKPTSDGAVQSTYKSSNGNKSPFGEKPWNKVVAAKGDFSVIGIHLITNSPVAGFDDYVHGGRKDRIQVE